MAANVPNVLPHVWPHSVHCLPSQQGMNGSQQRQSDSVSLLALQPLPAADTFWARRKETLWHVLEQQLVLNETCPTNERAVSQQLGCHTRLSDTALVIEHCDCGFGVDRKFTMIPLLVADVVYIALPKGHRCRAGNLVDCSLVAVAPQLEAVSSACYVVGSGSTELHPHSKPKHLDRSPQGVWVFSVAGSSLELQRFLFDLSARGALRCDMHDCFQPVKSLLGVGGYGLVFRGRSVIHDKCYESGTEARGTTVNLLCGSQVAIKTSKRHTSQDVRDRFKAEIGFLAKVRGHPNIVEMYGAFCALDQTEGTEQDQEAALGGEQRPDATRLRFFIVMELCVLGDLFNLLAEGPLDEMGVVALQKGLFSALGHLHSQHVLHRDVKPENILMDAHFQPKLADFGSAANMQMAEDMAKRVCSPGYTAPEILTGRAYDEMSDIFSAGVVTYYSLSCKQPFEALTRAETLQLNKACKVRYPAAWFGHVSERLMSLMMICLSKNPSRRPCAQRCLDKLLVHGSEGCVTPAPSASLAAAHECLQPRFGGKRLPLAASNRVARLPKIYEMQPKLLEGAVVSVPAGSSSDPEEVGPKDAQRPFSAVSFPNQYDSRLRRRRHLSKSHLVKSDPPHPSESLRKPVRLQSRLSASATWPIAHREMQGKPVAGRRSLSSRTWRWIASMLHKHNSPAFEERASFAAVSPVQSDQGSAVVDRGKTEGGIKLEKPAEDQQRPAEDRSQDLWGLSTAFLQVPLSICQCLPSWYHLRRQ
eukprot:TRINITY_DN6424_c0_g1_i3.p1 TRINITY_DN6424_c0_g1~~TRINITY_DN6424_c0_g1_i3.p1  ORF type:complete len:770 (-),score=101.77 TRINITY_DN6424_c0_g1_i3:21-2297(-)